MADPVISYTRLSHAIEVTRKALNWLIGFIDNTKVVGASKFLTTDSNSKINGTIGFGSSDPNAVSSVYGPGSSDTVSRGDHTHPNTCPTPTLGNQIANKEYVDNGSKVSASLGGIPNSINLTANTPVNITYNGVVCAATTGVTIFTNNYFRIDKSGRYRLSFFGSYTSSSAADISAVITINGTDTYIGSKGTRSGSPTSIVSGGANGVLDLVATNTVSVKLVASANTTINHVYAGFSIESV